MRTRATLLNLAPTEGTITDNHLVISLVGEDTGSQRPRLGIVPVVDRSGSMGSADKLGIVTRALGYLSSYLGDDDHLALVAFDTTVDTLLPASRADQHGAAAFAEALRSLRPCASTNLSDGIAQGLAAASSMPTDSLARVIVLTDGQANAGITDRAGLVALLADTPEHVSVSFLGVGRDCDHDLLGALAAAGRGSYGFIEAADRAADVLGAEVGGLLETEVHRMRVKVTARRQYLQLDTDVRVLGLDPALASTPEGAQPSEVVEIEVGHLLVGQTRHLVLPVRMVGPKRRHARPVTVAEVAVLGVIDETDVTVEIRPKAHFGGPAAELGSEVDDDVVTAVELAKVAHAQRQAEEAAARGDFTRARSMFADLNVNSGAALGMSQSLAMNYVDRAVYGASATMRSSSTHALRGSLAGSGEAFDALAARTIGSYTTEGQRDVASATAQVAVTNSKGGTGKSTMAGNLADYIAGGADGAGKPTRDASGGDVTFSSGQQNTGGTIVGRTSAGGGLSASLGLAVGGDLSTPGCGSAALAPNFGVDLGWDAFAQRGGISPASDGSTATDTAGTSGAAEADSTDDSTDDGTAGGAR